MSKIKFVYYNIVSQGHLPSVEKLSVISRDFVNFAMFGYMVHELAVLKFIFYLNFPKQEHFISDFQ